MDRGNGAGRGRLSIRIAALSCAIAGVVMVPSAANAATAGNGIYNIYVQDSGSLWELHRNHRPEPSPGP